MPPRPDEQRSDEFQSPPPPNTDQLETLHPEATADASLLTPDPDATVDGVHQDSECQVHSESESVSEAVDPDATHIPRSNVQNNVKEWEATLSEDSEPDQTLKAPPSAVDSNAKTEMLTVVLRRRDVSRRDENKAQSDTLPSTESDYETEKLLGEGGMGAVFSARQQSMDRPVAIKVLKSRAARLESSRLAFISEAVITGGLDHPNIVPIYEVGKQSDDALFYAMKQVEGVEWTERISQNTVTENLEILLRVSDAIAFSHARHIIHRDLKPANIMLGAFGEVLVMDWGLAMPTQNHPRRDSFPRPKRGGTPHYMAPEMAGDPMLDVDCRSDVYLLGAMLFEIVTGKAPHVLDPPPKNRREHVKACLAAVAENAIAETDETGELIEIAQKALSTDPADRYQTVTEFQATIREYLEHEESIELDARASLNLADAIRTQDYDDFARARFGFEQALELWPNNHHADEGRLRACLEFARCAQSKNDFDLGLSLLDITHSAHQTLHEELTAERQVVMAREQQLAEQQQARQRLKRALTVTATVGLIIVTCLGTYSEIQRRDAVKQRGLADENATRAENNRLKAETESANAKQSAALAESRREEAEASASAEVLQRKRVEKQLYFNQLYRAASDIQAGRHAQATALLTTVPEHLRHWEFGYLTRQAAGTPLVLLGHENVVCDVALSPDNRLIASSSYDGSVKVWNAETGQVILTFPGHEQTVCCVAFSPNGQQIASGGLDRIVKVWHPETGEEALTYRSHLAHVKSLAYSPDGMLIASASNDGAVRVWNSETGAEVVTPVGHEDDATSVAFSPDGTQFVSGGQDDTVKLWSTATGKELRKFIGHSDWVTGVAFSRDGRQIVSSSNDKTVKVWNAKTGDEEFTLQGHQDVVKNAGFSPDGRTIVSASSDGTVKIWNTDDRTEARTWRGHEGPVESLAISNDGRRIISGGSDKTVRVWNSVGNTAPLTLYGHEKLVYSVAFSPDSRQIVTGSEDKTVRVWDIATGTETLKLSGHEDDVFRVAVSSDGNTIASGGSDKTVRLWNVKTGSETLTLRGHERPIRGLAFTQDGQQLVSASDDGIMKIWDTQSGKELRTLQGKDIRFWCVAFSPDGRHVASGCSDKTVRIWDAETGAELVTLPGHMDEIASVSFSPDGKRVVSGTGQRHKYGELRIWDVETGAELVNIRGHSDVVIWVAYSPDGRRIVSGSLDKTVKVWDAETGTEAITLRGHRGEVWSVAFSPDGRRIVSGGEDLTVKVWDSEPGQETFTLSGHQSTIFRVSISQDGKRIVSGSEDKTIRVWDAATQTELITIRGNEHNVNDVAFSPDGRWIVAGIGAYGRSSQLKILNAETGKERLTLGGHDDYFKSVDFSQDGKWVVAHADEERSYVWNASTGELMAEADPPQVVTENVSKDGQLRVIPYGNDIRLIRKNGDVNLWSEAAKQRAASTSTRDDRN